MRFHTRLVIVTLWFVSLAVVAVLAQTPRATPPAPSTQPMIFSGNDLGFRADSSQRGGRVVGTLVVRINGQWVDAAFSQRVTPATR